MRRIQGGDDGPFEDCGMLFLDCRERPLLILCAGHGGCGTLATVLALQCQHPIEERLRQSRDAESGMIGADRVYEIVRVNRRKPTRDPLDDFDFDRTIDTGWSFAWE